jgi:hypothetical protein
VLDTKSPKHLEMAQEHISLSGRPPLAFLISHPRAFHTTLIVALFSRVVLHVPINIMILS